MERDLTRWLKDDLGLKHLSEADLNGLMYHPRHGNLCRRFLRFLADSTLCSKKYPNVNAREEYQASQLELEERCRELDELMLQLGDRIEEHDNVERELVALRERRTYVKKIEDLIQTTDKAFERMADRPNFTFEQVRKSLEKPKYLDVAALDSLYSAGSFNRSPSPIGERHKKKLGQQFDELEQSAEVLHRGIGLLLAEAKRLARIASNVSLDLKWAPLEQLEALKVPECEEVELEVDRLVGELVKQHDELKVGISVERQQVTELKRQYETRRQSLDQRYEQELKECSDFVAKLAEFEAIISGSADKSQRN